MRRRCAFYSTRGPQRNKKRVHLRSDGASFTVMGKGDPKIRLGCWTLLGLSGCDLRDGLRYDWIHGYADKANSISHLVLSWSFQRGRKRTENPISFFPHSKSIAGSDWLQRRSIPCLCLGLLVSITRFIAVLWSVLNCSHAWPGPWALTPLHSTRAGPQPSLIRAGSMLLFAADPCIHSRVDDQSLQVEHITQQLLLFDPFFCNFESLIAQHLRVYHTIVWKQIIRK